jgi:hypothetical protein
MLEFNVQQEFGQELTLDSNELSTAHSVLTDGRMQPYEWIAASSGKLLKTDAISHGDNHFFPGPCDIAWDLAGAAIEWDLPPAQLQYLLNRFRQNSGIDVSSRMSIYSLAYCTFRLGLCKMAESTVRGSEEEQRLERAYLYYRKYAEGFLMNKVSRRA